MDNRLKQVIKLHIHNGYSTDYFKNFRLPEIIVKPGVFRPEVSFLGLYLSNFLFTHKNLFRGLSVLDVGCGCGIQGLIVAKNGAKEVICSDVSNVAVNNAKLNIKINKLLNATAVKSNLFSGVKTKFDLVLFNAPFFSEHLKKGDKSIAGTIVSDSGLMTRFLRELPSFLLPRGFAILPQSGIHGNDNNPIKIANSLGYKTEILAKDQDEVGDKRIVKITP